MSIISSSLSNLPPSIATGIASQMQQSQQQVQITNEKIIECIVLGKMHEYNIPKENLIDVQKFIYVGLMKNVFHGVQVQYNYSYFSMVYDICNNILPNYKFNNDMKTLLDT